MKGWCKILKVEGYDMLVERLVTKEDGEHVKVTIRIPDGPEAEEEAIKLYKNYKKANAQEFIDELNKLIEANEKEDDNKKS